MVFHTEFHKWNLLPEEMKLECIKHVDLRTRFLLRDTFRTERRLVNSQRFNLTKVSIEDGESEHGKHIEVDIFEKSLEGRLINFEFTKEEMIPTAVPFISFLLENAYIARFSYAVLKDLRFLTKISELRVRNFYGYVTRHMLPVLEKCRPNTMEKLEIRYESRGSFPMDTFLNYPMVDSVKRWYFFVEKSPDLGQKIGRKWMELDVDVGSKYRFNKAKNEDMESFTTAFPDEKLVQKTDKLIRIETRNPKKHLLLIISKDEMLYNIRKKEWTLLMVPKDFPESKYANVGGFLDFS
ncbi:hypothetical protein CAEBREN_12359 [Caenorhabditis brenneri]|uniref:Uncharacterized protein n=1 Tax=Caenorhabditis brenneri TaxID=135651 RepID=G0MDP3_CAEBE|nr:hypothetical protein CAEBREN_12359 [Caenorhabditis brenneri]